MSLVEENLPGVGRVRKDFQVREDHVIAKNMQEREYEEHFDYNVQARRTAMQDAQMAKSFQMNELSSFKEEESIRKERLRQQEERDREEAEKYLNSLEQQEAEAKRKDEEIVQQMHREEMEREAQRKRQEEEDMRMARQHSVDTQQFVKQRQEEELLGQKEAQRLASTKEFELPSYESLGFVVPKATQPTEEEEDGDENARQEEEDARIAREMMEREEREAERRRLEQEQADIEMARRLQEMESNSNPSRAPPPLSRDEEMARRMELDAKERRRKLEEQARADEELAQRMRADLNRRESEQETTDWELAKKLQKAELVAHKKATASRTAGEGGRGGVPPGISPTQSAPASLTGGQRKPQVQPQPTNTKTSTKTKQEPVQLTGYQMPDPAEEGDESPRAIQSYKRQQKQPSSAKGKKSGGMFGGRK